MRTEGEQVSDTNTGCERRVAVGLGPGKLQRVVVRIERERGVQDDDGVPVVRGDNHNFGLVGVENSQGGGLSHGYRGGMWQDGNVDWIGGRIRSDIVDCAGRK